MVITGGGCNSINPRPDRVGNDNHCGGQINPWKLCKNKHAYKQPQ